MCTGKRAEEGERQQKAAGEAAERERRVDEGNRADSVRGMFELDGPEVVGGSKETRVIGSGSKVGEAAHGLAGRDEGPGGFAAPCAP